MVFLFFLIIYNFPAPLPLSYANNPWSLIPNDINIINLILSSAAGVFLAAQRHARSRGFIMFPCLIWWFNFLWREVSGAEERREEEKRRSLPFSSLSLLFQISVPPYTAHVRSDGRG